MKQLLATLAIAATLVSCGKSDDTSESKQQEKKSTTPVVDGTDPGAVSKGANLCLKCNLRTDANTCPKCKATLKVKMETKAPTHASGSGNTSVGAMWVCPQPKCTVSFPSEEECAKHKGTLLVEQLYTCSKCSSEETVPGNCSGCGAKLAATVER